MSIITRPLEHTQDGLDFDSLLVLDSEQPSRAPAVLVFHGWEGRSAEQENFAKRLTAWGYAGIAVDLYGNGQRGTTTEECQALMTPLMTDRGTLRKRLLRVVEVAQGLPEIDARNLAAIGFCFGGLCALDVARAGANLKGVASFHGPLTPPGLPSAHPFHCKVIAFHGWDDPLVAPDQTIAFGNELTAAGADWQLHAYGATKHAFMNESAKNVAMGLLYNERSAQRAWNELRLFLAELFTES